MFGEKDIYGQKIIKTIIKNRIIIPEFTYVEKGDCLLVLKNEDCLSLYKEEDIKEYINKLKFKLENSISEEELKIVNLKLMKLYETIVRRVTCDAQKRVVLGEIIKDWEEILCIGAIDHIILKKSK